MKAKRLAVVGFLLLFGICLAQSQTATKSDAEVSVETEQAQALVDKQNYVAALPLYEDLHGQRPQSLVYTERLAFSLLAKAAQQTPEEAQTTRSRAKQLLSLAKDGGDDSNLLEVVLEKLENADKAGPPEAQPVGYEWMVKAEAAFSSGDLQTALGFYQKALEVNPQYYTAALFAGDAEYKMHHPAQAGAWFAKAIAINPDIETAYRYWGDSLEKAGEHQRAEEEFIAAIVADPYSRSPRVGLKQWANASHAVVVPPPIKLPAKVAESSDGHINITLPSDQKEDSETSIELAYSMQSVLWQGDEFKKHFPNEKAYRHSLAEEAQSIRLMLSIANETKIQEKKLSTSTRLLKELDKNGMLECWILLDDPDQGIAQDYAAYRKDHRDLLARYIARYDVHPM